MEIFTTEALISLLTLTALEIILGIDNIVFISILAGRVPPAKQAQTRQLGLFIGMGIRILLLMAISWIMRLDQTLFSVFNQDITGKDLILILGGLFLLYQSTKEIHEKLEGAEGDNAPQSGAAYGYIILQLAIINIVFSLDSVITAIGMADLLWVMITAVVLSVAVMFFAAKPISDFVNKHPTVKILALSFLFLIGVSLIAEGFHQHISKGYIYFAMTFSFVVEMVNMRFRKKATPVKLHDKYVDPQNQ